MAARLFPLTIFEAARRRPGRAILAAAWRLTTPLETPSLQVILA